MREGLPHEFPSENGLPLFHWPQGISFTPHSMNKESRGNTFFRQGKKCKTLQTKDLRSIFGGFIFPKLVLTFLQSLKGKEI